MKIFKYPLRLVDEQKIALPQRSQILTVQMQNEALCLWALVDPNLPLEKRIIRVVGTGNEFDDPEKCFYLGTVQERVFVWHVFEFFP